MGTQYDGEGERNGQMWVGLRSLPHTSWCSVLHPISLCNAFRSQTQCLKEADTGLPSSKEKSP